MGTRENQGLQIALMLFVTMTVVLGVTTYIYWKQAEELAAQRAADRAVQQQSAETIRGLIAELSAVKQVLGHDPAATLAEIRGQGERDLSLFAESYQGPRNYLALPPFLFDEIAKRNRLIADLEQANGQFAADLRERSVQGAAQLAIAQQDRENLRREQELQQATFLVDRHRFTADSTKIASQLEAQGRRTATLVDEHQKEVNSLLGRNADLTRLVSGLRTLLDALRDKGEAETADGRITFVDQRTRTVGIDLGSADGVRRGMTFAVVDRDAVKVGAAKKKGNIEVVSIDGEHTAIGKILADDLRDPILSSDQIFTAAWQPGQKVRFALAGLLDLDGDGHTDRGTIRSLIERHGGVIDAEVDELGATHGSLEFETRYLVVGARPSDRASEAGLKGYVSMIAAAERIGVEKLPLDKFLQMVGYRAQGKTILLGGDSPRDRPALRRPATP